MLLKNVNHNGKTVLVTGAAGFIGCKLCKKLLNDYNYFELVGLDSITDYYDVNFKYERLKDIELLVYASSSSVYGSNKKIPYFTDDKVECSIL